MSNDQNLIDSEYSPLDTLIINLKSGVIQEKDLYPEQKEQLSILYGENWMFLLGLRPFSEIPAGSPVWEEIMAYKRDNELIKQNLIDQWREEETSEFDGLSEEDVLGDIGCK